MTGRVSPPEPFALERLFLGVHSRLRDARPSRRGALDDDGGFLAARDVTKRRRPGGDAAQVDADAPVDVRWGTWSRGLVTRNSKQSEYMTSVTQTFVNLTNILGLT